MHWIISANKKLEYPFNYKIEPYKASSNYFIVCLLYEPSDTLTRDFPCQGTSCNISPKVEKDLSQIQSRIVFNRWRAWRGHPTTWLWSLAAQRALCMSGVCLLDSALERSYLRLTSSMHALSTGYSPIYFIEPCQLLRQYFETLAKTLTTKQSIFFF